MWFALVYGCIGALAFAAFLWRLVLAARTPQNPAQWAVAFAILASGIGFEAAVPQTYTWIGDVSGVPNLASLIVYGAIATAVVLQIVWTAYMVSPERSGAGEPGQSAQPVRKLLILHVLVLTTMTVLFALAPVHDEVHDTDFDHYYGREPLAVAFLGIYLAVYTVALLRIILLCRTWIGQLDTQTWLRRGLRLLAVGGTIALGYAVGKVIAIVGSWFDIDLKSLNTDIAPAFASLGAIFMLTGYLCPSLVPWAARTRAQLRALPRLRPLWTALQPVAPELAQSPLTRRPASRDQLYRRVIEIRDWLLRLQPHLSAAATATAERLAEDLAIPAEQRTAAVEAARIAAALYAREQGIPETNEDETFTDPDKPSLAGELDWLVTVAEQYSSSPLVPAVLAELASSSAP